MRTTLLRRDRLEGVASVDEMRRILAKNGQQKWCTRVRLCGLLLLVDLVCRKQTSKGVPISADRASKLISPLKRPNSREAIREPLAVLCQIGILRRVQAAVNGRDVKASARYAIDDAKFARRLTLEVHLPPFLAKKRETDTDRCEASLNRRYPFRAQLKADLTKLRFGVESRKRITELSRDRKAGPSVRRVVEVLGGSDRPLKINPRGQITTPVSGCPRELKPLLLLDGEPTSLCDVSCAHFCFLPVLLRDRIDHLEKEHGLAVDVSRQFAELRRLVDLLSTGDFYARYCVDPDDPVERKQKKLFLNILLNSPTAECEEKGLYRRMRAELPYTISVIEDIKRENHRNLSKRLQHLTAKAINGALFEAQAKGITAIPDVDAIVCQARHKEIVCELIGQKVYEISRGVCSKVGGIRYAPSDSRHAGPTDPSPSKSALAAAGPKQESGSAAAPPTATVNSRPNVAEPLQEFDGEARRIAGELVMLHRDGAIKGPADTLFFACLIRDFCATYSANGSDEPKTSPPLINQRVRVPHGLSKGQRERFVQKDLDDAIA